MKNKENIIWLLFPIIWGFWFFLMPGHIGNSEGTNFFQHGCAYWSNFACKPGGWSDYIEHFLLQFYQWNWIGALIQTLPLVGVFVFTRGIIKKIGVEKNSLILSSLPIILIFILQNQVHLVEGQAIEIFFFFLLIWGYLSIKKTFIRYSITTLISPTVFLILGGVGTIAFYLSISLYEIWRNKGASRIYFIAIWLLIVTAQPFIWREYVQIMSMEHIYDSFITRNDLVVPIYGYFILLLFISWLNKKVNINKDLFIAEVLFIATIFGLAIFYAPNYKIERLYSLDQAVINGNWDEVLNIAVNIENPCREEMYLINLALSGKKTLGDHLFEYNSDWGTAGLYLPREFDYTTNMLGGELYYRLKIPNEAIHWTFQGAVNSPQGMDFRSLKRLIEANILKNDTIIADKYLTILENTTHYSYWCEERREEISNPQTKHILPSNPNDFFIGSRPFISDMARIIDRSKDQKMALDYILCYLLLNKDLGKFYTILDKFYDTNDNVLAKAYQEAILIDIHSKKRVLKKRYLIDKEVSKQFAEYKSTVNLYNNSVTKTTKKQAKVFMSSFDNTLWYYLNFTTPPPINPRGQVQTK